MATILLNWTEDADLPTQGGDQTPIPAPGDQGASVETEGAAPGTLEGEDREERPTEGQTPPAGEEGTASSTGGSGEAGDGTAQTLAEMPPRQESGIPLLPLAAVCGAVVLAAAAVWFHRRRRRASAGAAVNPGGEGCPRKIRGACLHELGDRDSQQDAFLLTREGQEVLAAVADGMGGLVNSGQVSSALVEALEEGWRRAEQCPPERRLQLLLRQALDRVEEQLRGSTAQSGSTLVMGMVRDGALSWLSVGDSRIYLWRGGGLIQLSRDHDFHHDLVLLALQGDLTLSEADQDPRRDNLTSFIGRGFPRKVEWNQEPVPLRRGDRVLLVSDGVYRALSLEEMAACLDRPPEEAAAALGEAVRRKAYPQQDNYTAVILEAR